MRNQVWMKRRFTQGKQQNARKQQNKGEEETMRGKRVICALLALFMLLTLVPPMALANPNPGDYSIRLQGDGTIAASRFTPHRSLNFNQNAVTLHFSVLVRGNATGFRISAGGNGGIFDFVPARTVNYADWTEITSTVTTTAGTAADWRTFVIEASNDAANDLFVTNISIIRGDNGANMITGANNHFQQGTWAGWFLNDSWAVDWLGAPTNPGNNWSVVSNTPPAPTYTVTRDAASTVPAENMTITPDGAQQVGAEMTVTITPPAGQEIAADSIAVTGVPGIALTATGATFPMPAGGGAIVVNAAFAAEDLTADLTAFVDAIDADIAGGALLAGDWTEASWVALQGALAAARTALAPPIVLAEVRDAYTALRAARSSLVSALQVSFDEFMGRVDNFNVSEWNGVPHESVTANGLTLRAAASDTTLYAIVEGDDRDTRNVFYISIAGEAGHNRIGRPDVNFLVANGYLYRTTTAQATNATPEWFGSGGTATATRVDRISMEYHTHWTGMRLRLDQIGNPDPADISISWQGFSTRANCPLPSFASTTRADLPTDTSALMPIGNFSRPNAATYYPAESFALLPNPLVGGPGTGGTGATAQFNRVSHDYVTWRGLQPERGAIDLAAARRFGWASDYPIHGPNRDQWGTRGGLLTPHLQTLTNNEAHFSLRFVMDVPTGAGGPALPQSEWQITQAQFNALYPFGPSRNIEQINRSMINLMNRRVADIPDWVVADMRRQSNRPNDDCPHNIPFMPDFDPGVPNEIMHIPGDNLYTRMRDPYDPYAIFWQGFRDQPFLEYENIIYHNGVRVTDGLFRCAIPNPNGGPDLRVCPNGCIPYRRPAGLRQPGGYCPNETHYIQEHFGFNPNLNWGPEGMWYFSWPAISGGIGLAPRYEHHMLLYYVEEIMGLIAQEVARTNSPWRSIAQVQVGLLGHWGEFHNWPTASAGTFPDAEIVYPFIRAVVDAFACNDNVQIGMRYANWIATKYDLGFFHDQGGQTAHFSVFNTIAGQNLNPDNFEPNGWGRGHNTGVTSITDNLNANMWNVPAFTGLGAQQYANAARNPTFWMTGGWSGGEWGDSSSGTWHRDVPLGTLNPEFNAIMNTIYSFRWANVSNKAPRGPTGVGNLTPGTADAQRQAKNNDAAYDNMGYRFVVEEVNVDGILRRGETVDVSMTVANRGTAPFLRNWPFEVSFIDAGGAVAHTMVVDDVNITEWLPRHRAINNARPAPTAYRYVDSAVTGNPVRVYYRTFEELGELPIWPADHPNFIPAFDGRNPVEFSLAIPTTLSGGEYTIAIAILDPVLRNNQPTIRFHNVGLRTDRRLPLTGLVVGQNEDARVWNATVAGDGTVTPRGAASPGEPVTITVDTRVGYALTAASIAGEGIDQGTVIVNLPAQTLTFLMPVGAPNAPLAVTVTPTWDVATSRTWNATVVGDGNLIADTGAAVPGAAVELTLADRENFNLTALSVAGPGIVLRNVTVNLDARTIRFIMPAGADDLSVTVSPTWEQLPFGPADNTVTVDPASTALTGDGTVAITPEGPQRAGTPMTVIVTAPEALQVAPGSLAVTGVPNITLTANGATFPMPAGGGAITVNAVFEEEHARVRLQALVSRISELVIGGELRPEMFTEASWTALWGVGVGAHPLGYTMLWWNADRYNAYVAQHGVSPLVGAYQRLRAAYEGLVPAEATGISFTLPATIRRNQAVTPVLTVLPAGALQEATWTSSSPALASVDPNTGVVTARATSGTVVITATTLCGNFRHSVTVRLSA